MLLAFVQIGAQLGDGSEDCTKFMAEDIVMAWLQLMLLVMVTMTLAGCELVGGIFKAGAWVGAIGVLLVIGLVAVLAVKIRG